MAQVRTVGGFRLDECYITSGVCHRFVLLVFDSDGPGCMEPFMLRMQRECGVCSDAWPGYGSAVSDQAGCDGRRIWTHPGFRLVVDRRRKADPALKCWTIAGWDNRCLGSGTHTREALRAVRSRICAAVELLAPDERVGCIRRRCVVVEDRRVVRRPLADDAAPPPPYPYEKRANDDKWTLGWA
jgi:hypothetical protein